MWAQNETRRSRPGAFHGDVLEPVIDKLENPRTAVDMRNDLQQVVRFGERSGNGFQVGGRMLVSHRAGRDAHDSVVERADKGILVWAERGLRVFLRKTPKLTTAIDRRPVVEEHGVRV